MHRWYQKKLHCHMDFSFFGREDVEILSKIITSTVQWNRERKINNHHKGSNHKFFTTQFLFESHVSAGNYFWRTCLDISRNSVVLTCYCSPNNSRGFRFPYCTFLKEINFKINSGILNIKANGLFYPATCPGEKLWEITEKASPHSRQS